MDAVNGSPRALLRMDNCILDEEGVVSLRLGSQKLNATAFSTKNVDSLYAVNLNGTKYRFGQGSGSLYVDVGAAGNYLALQSGFDTALDIQFSSYLGQIFFASGGNKYKYDGTLRAWGISAPSDTPTTSFAGAGIALTGTYTWLIVYVRDNGSYVAQSGPSHPSVSASPVAQAVQIACNNPTDTQVNQIWLFRSGNTLDQYYQVAIKTVTSWTGTTTIDDPSTDAAALTVDVKLESDNQTPPDNVVDISEDYYNRIFVLTSDGTVWPSRQLDPDSFSTGQALKVFGKTEVGYWIQKTFGGLYVGTSKDIYRIEGDGAEYPDGTINFVLTPMNVNSPPVDMCLATDGNILIYRASDGPRLFAGQSSTPIRGDTDLLWKGYTRHGVSPVNSTEGSRFRSAIAAGNLYMLIPEGADTTTSAVYRYNMAKQRWYRHIYPPAFRSIYREPDGTLVAGDAFGFVRKLETGSTDDGSAIPFTIWTPIEDDGKPLNRKIPQRLRLRLDTGNSTIGCAGLLEGSTSQAFNINSVQNGEAFSDNDLTGVNAFTQVQLQITGSSSAFKLYEYALEYADLPTQTWGKMNPVNLGSSAKKEFTGIQIRACTLNQHRTFTPIVDNISYQPLTISTVDDYPKSFTVQLPTPVLGNEIRWTVDGNIELYDWKPNVSFTLPYPVTTYDFGPIDLGSEQLFWIRRFVVKAYSPAGLTLIPYLDGVEFTSSSAKVVANQVERYDFAMGRECKCEQLSNVRITAGGHEFSIYSLQIFFRPAGGEIQRKVVEVQ